MSLSPRSGRQPLKSFRLSEVPEPIRVAAALRHADELARALKTDKGGRAGGRYEGLSALNAAIMARQVATRPSDTVYRVPLAAWERVMGQ